MTKKKIAELEPSLYKIIKSSNSSPISFSIAMLSRNSEAGMSSLLLSSFYPLSGHVMTHGQFNLLSNNLLFAQETHLMFLLFVGARNRNATQYHPHPRDDHMSIDSSFLDVSRGQVNT
jgi:hypothetical protein